MGELPVKRDPKAKETFGLGNYGYGRQNTERHGVHWVFYDEDEINLSRKTPQQL